MHSIFGKRGALLAGLLALAVTAITPSMATAVPEPGAGARGFRLFARATGALTINRVYCGLTSTGEVCVDSTNSSTIGGGYWPKGSPNQYVFNSGLQLAGLISSADPSNPWAGDTTGGFFFDPKGTTQHGQQVEPIYNATNADDFANWPEAAKVPFGDATADLFFPLLQGRNSASQGDVWFMSWEGNPGSNAGRPHPLGVAVESRGMGWNFPAGNEDILYFIYTFYNITSLNPADYAAVRPAMRDILIAQAQQFHSLNNAAFAIDLPDGGYTIESMYAAFAADMDVGANAGNNYSTVVLPFALGQTYEANFASPAEYQFDPGIFSDPFFPAVGFVGVKYLKSPTGAGAIQLFSNTINGGAFGDPQNTTQLYRYLSGNISSAAGDANCNEGPASITRLCFVNNANPADMRFFQSSTALTLAPGEFGSIVVAYIFAAPVAVASYTQGTRVTPGDPTIMADAAALNSTGANLVDSIMGFRDFTDGNGDGIPQQDEFSVVQGSLLGKSLVAQTVFDNKFLLPFAPDAPEFFLVPGDDQVSVLWRPSPSETNGDPFFAIASSATITPAGGGAPTANPLYDPNYRQFDVEGYRVYRGRVNSPDQLTLLAQFDYAGTSILDFSASVNPTAGCAPEFDILESCPVAYDPATFQPGVERTVFNEVPLTGLIEQIIVPGGRAPLRSGGVVDTLVASVDTSVASIDSTIPLAPDTTFAFDTTFVPVFLSESAVILTADTAVTGGGSGFPGLRDTGVPFVYVDQDVRNNFRYFYAVTAFDVNSFQSGLSSLESARITKPVTPNESASNQQFAASFSQGVFGRGVERPTAPLPTVDPTVGTFSGPFPAANGWDAEVLGFVPQLVRESGAAAIRLDSMTMGDAYGGVPVISYITVNPGPTQVSAVLSHFQDPTAGTDTSSTTFPLVAVDAQAAQTFGVNPALQLTGGVTSILPGNYFTASFGRGCVNGASPFVEGRLCSYAGVRWFEGPSPANNETAANPTAPGNQSNTLFGSIPSDLGNYNNAGSLPGVSVIHEPRSYVTIQTLYRQLEGAIGTVARAADFNVHWGAGGAIDSVVDITHNVTVPFDSTLGATWAILNASGGAAGGSRDTRPAVLTIADWGCVEPLRSLPGPQGILACTSAAPFTVSTTAELGQLAQVSAGVSNSATRPVSATPGFSIYLPGHIFLMEMSALPAAGTVWTLRSYVGALNGGRGGDPGDEGDYAYEEVVQPFTAAGAEVRLQYDVTNQLVSTSEADLEQVHTVPDPYYITSEFEQSSDNKIIKFVNLPNAATIRIYSSSGVLVDVIEHNSAQAINSATWDVRNRNNQVVASGVYFYHIEAGDARRVGRFTIVNFAQ